VPSFEEHTVRKIGRYEVIRKIATGGMAELFLARFVGPGGFEKRCALKRILPQFAADTTFTRMFLTEARVTAMFDHPNLVQIFELGQDDEGQFYIAMELVNGMNLRQLLHMCRERGQLLPPELAAYMMTQALDGLAYAHEFRDEEGRPLNLVHRDVSPQNILLSYEGAVKVVDFGIVKGSSISGETQAGMLKGKVASMSPEQAQGDPIDGRSDLFSIGVCLYELIAGEKPFTGNNEIMCLKAILEHDPPPITDYAPDCPEGIERVIYKALAKQREHRQQSARQFQLELQEVLKNAPTSIGRHVVSEYLKSLTESGTEQLGFDSTRLRIPRTTPPSDRSQVRFAPSYPSIPLADIPNAQSNPSLSKRPAPRGSSNAALDGHSPTPVATGERSLSGETGLTNELRAAGLGRFNPMVLLVFALSALAGGLAVFFATREDRSTVVIEVPSTPPERLAVPTEVPPAQPTKPIEPPPPAEPAPKIEEPAPTTVAAKTTSKREKKRERAAERERERERERPAAAHTGTLAMTSTPRGLTVMLENDVLGKTPLAGAPLPAGTHTLKLVHKSLGISKKVTVKIAKGETTTETLTVGKGTLKVNSRPWSEVHVDGVLKGKTPLEIPIYEGMHEVRLVSPEAGERIQKVEIAAGETEDVRVRF
jgi:serine/threonine-protein kinase